MKHYIILHVSSGVAGLVCHLCISGKKNLHENPTTPAKCRVSLASDDDRVPGAMPGFAIRPQAREADRLPHVPVGLQVLAQSYVRLISRPAAHNQSG